MAVVNKASPDVVKVKADFFRRLVFVLILVGGLFFSFFPTPKAGIPNAVAQGIATDTPTFTETPTDTATSTPTFTFTPTPTFTNTPTFTPTSSLTPTNTIAPLMTLLINEVAWAGTKNSAEDEWIELFNTTNNTVVLTNWKLVYTSFESPPISFSITFFANSCNGNPCIIEPGGYFLLERRVDSNDKTPTFKSSGSEPVVSDFIYLGALSDNGAVLRLYSDRNTVVDSANLNAPNRWYSGSKAPNYGSMERRLGFPDGPYSWITNTGVMRYGYDNAGNPIWGTPKRENWANKVTPTTTVTLTHTPTGTRTYVPVMSTPLPTRTPTPIKDYVVLNEVQSWPGKDLNSDGKDDSGDEFIEIINVSNFVIPLGGWALDDENPSTPAYSLAAFTLSPGQRLAFFASQSGLYLPNSGGRVKLIRPGGLPADIYDYSFVERRGFSYCRLPEGTGPWYFGCEVSPSMPNIFREDQIPTPAPIQPGVNEGCPLPGVDPRVEYADCYAPGLDLWNPEYWNFSREKDLPIFLGDPYSNTFVK